MAGCGCEIPGVLTSSHGTKAGKCKLTLFKARFKNGCCERTKVRINPDFKG